MARREVILALTTLLTAPIKAYGAYQLAGGARGIRSLVHLARQFV